MEVLHIQRRTTASPHRLSRLHHEQQRYGDWPGQDVRSGGGVSLRRFKQRSGLQRVGATGQPGRPLGDPRRPGGVLGRLGRLTIRGARQFGLRLSGGHPYPSPSFAHTNHSPRRTGANTGRRRRLLAAGATQPCCDEIGTAGRAPSAVSMRSTRFADFEHGRGGLPPLSRRAGSCWARACGLVRGNRPANCKRPCDDVTCTGPFSQQCRAINRRAAPVPNRVPCRRWLTGVLGRPVRSRRMGGNQRR